MRRNSLWLALAALVLAPPTLPAAADSAATPTLVDLAPPTWSGGYVGVEAGAGRGTSDISNPYGTSIYGDAVRTPEFLIGLAAGYNWQAPGSAWVYGVEGALSYQDADGSNTCFAASGELTSSNCFADPDWTGTLAGRLGYALGPTGRTLLFAKGGLAFQHSDVEATTNHRFGAPPINRTSASTTSWGWMLGGGVEQMVAPAWSVKLEYDYLDFASHDMATPPTFSTTPGGTSTALASRTASIDQTNHLVKIGLNYRFGADPLTGWSAPAPAVSSAPNFMWPGWSFETAARYVYSVGRFQENLGTQAPRSNISRLTYADLSTHAAEWYARLDSPWGLFLKGFVGGGRITDGHLNDEDWGLTTSAPFTAYSNTFSNLADTHMNYLTVDAGYDFLNGPGYKVGVLAGYSHIREEYTAIDCYQIASPSSGICSPPIHATGITERDRWDSLRLGFETVAWLSPALKLTADTAYLPYVKFNGVDNHWLRSLVFNETGVGQGAQLEALLSYYVSPEFSLGIGGRYWAIWVDDGTDKANGVPSRREEAFRYERVGVFVEASYRFDGGPE